MGISYQLLSTVSAVRVIKKRKKEKKRARPNSALSYSPVGEGGRGEGKKGAGNWQRQNCDHYCHFLQESGCQPENYARVTQEQ